MSYTVTVSPSQVYSGQRITINVPELNVPGGETYDYGILRNGVTVYGYDPDTSVIIQEHTGPVSVTCPETWLGGGTDVLLTVRAYVWGAQYETADAVFRLRKGESVIPYTIDEEVAALPAAGWLPRDSKRKNLYRLMLANGVNIIKGPDGNPHFTYIGPAAAPESIDTDDIFLGGSVEYVKPYAAVSVTEHTFTPLTDENPVTLFDNTNDEPIVSKEVWFSQAPVVVETLSASAGLSIVFASENSAILTGQGVLTGVPYTHSTVAVRREHEGGERGKIAAVDDDTMISGINSGNVLDRLESFYCPESALRKIRTDMVYKGERLGQSYSFRGPFGEQETAYLASAELSASSFVRAACELYAGYTPAGQTGLYKHCIILDKTTYAEDGGVFTVPAEISQMENPQMKVVIIGGGTGGEGGGGGETGWSAPVRTNVAPGTDVSGVWYGGRGGDGGAEGLGGGPGRVRSVVIRNPSGTYNYTIGDGGEGGNGVYSKVGEPGEAGTASSFGEFSSDGPGSYVPRAGIYDPIHGNWYAIAGKKGIPGGKGGARQVRSGDSFVWVTSGENVRGQDGTVYHGGGTGSPMTGVEGLPECSMIAYGGNGAGAAVGVDRAEHEGMNGQSDQSASWEVSEGGV